ncbi:MAG: hypothetical protein EBR17_06190, partial [Betaproteobacteria bacterium]|nr:hypothetical protein [Betaproteobacteria bacterium]
MHGLLKFDVHKSLLKVNGVGNTIDPDAMDRNKQDRCQLLFAAVCQKLDCWRQKKATQLPGWLVRKGQGSKTPASLQWQKSLLEQ